jgi:phosphopantothenoylcysteine decarboxylase/phosphopantothenate--cysteine ligase
MTIIVTIGPTQEPLDAMRLISNRSTGELGTRLAVKIAQAGHRVIALRGTGATAGLAALDPACHRVIPFTTTGDLRRELERLSKEEQTGALFHAAAVSDFHLPGAGAGKIPTSDGSLTLTLEPTQKLLPLMRGWFPDARITGWKFEASGDRDASLAAGRVQIESYGTDACVVNGPSYGEGFGVLTKSGTLTHLRDREALCEHLAEKLPG